MWGVISLSMERKKCVMFYSRAGLEMEVGQKMSQLCLLTVKNNFELKVRDFVEYLR